jgi:hypothetical protein
MKKILVLPLVCCLLSFCGCIKNTISADIQPFNQNIREEERISNTPNDYCREWQMIKSKLSEEEIRKLEEYKIIIPRERPDDFNGYLLSAELVEDCEKRIEIGQVIRAIVSGTETDADRKFAKQNSKAIVSVILRIWDSCGFSVDGTTHEKYRLVNYKSFREEDNAILLANLLQEKKLNGGIVYAYLSHPIPSLVPTLRELLKEAGNIGNLKDEIVLAIMIEQSERKQAMVPKLVEFTQNNELSEQTKKGILMIIEKFKKGRAIKWENVENLQLELDDFEEERNGESILCDEGVFSVDHSNK